MRLHAYSVSGERISPSTGFRIRMNVSNECFDESEALTLNTRDSTILFSESPK